MMPYIIAEVSQNHDGSLGQAHAFIDAVAQTGANAIKFQTHIAEEESTHLEEFRVKFSYEDQTRYDYWHRMEFTREQWKGLYDHAVKKGLDFLSSPFSIKALRMLDEIGVPAWKFGSGEVFNTALIDEALNTHKPIILSTGLSSLEDIKGQVDYIKGKNCKVSVLYCITAYPSKAEEININEITLLKSELSCTVGISDHSATIYPSLAAVTLGAEIVEVHVTMSPYMFGPDVKASVTLEQLKEIVEGSRFITQMRESGKDIRKVTDEQLKLKQMFSKSIYFTRSLSKGHMLSEEDLAAKKPNIGVNADRMQEFIGRALVKDVTKDDVLTEELVGQ